MYRHHPVWSNGTAFYVWAVFCFLFTIIFTVVDVVKARGAPSYLSHLNISPTVHGRHLEMEIHSDVTRLRGSRCLKFSQSLWRDTQYRQISQLETGSKFVFLHQVELHFTLRICNNYYSLHSIIRRIGYIILRNDTLETPTRLDHLHPTSFLRAYISRIPKRVVVASLLSR